MCTHPFNTRFLTRTSLPPTQTWQKYWQGWCQSIWGTTPHTAMLGWAWKGLDWVRCQSGAWRSLGTNRLNFLKCVNGHGIYKGSIAKLSLTKIFRGLINLTSLAAKLLEGWGLSLAACLSLRLCQSIGSALLAWLIGGPSTEKQTGEYTEHGTSRDALNK